MKIGVVIMLVELENIKRTLNFREISYLANQAEDLGLDSIWIYDHLLYRNINKAGKFTKTTGIWEGWSMLSALAAVTRRVELGPLVACNSFRNPALLAKMAHTVDEISEGRLILGLGAGWNQPEYEAFGLPFDRRVDRFEEALQIVHPLLKEGRVDFQGKYYSARDCEIAPQSPRGGGIPLMIGCGMPRMLRLTARYADMWNVGYMSVPRSTDKFRRKMVKACRETGRAPESLEFTYMISMAYPDLMGWNQEKKRGHLSGSTEEIAQTLKDYELLGATHLMFHLLPGSAEGIERLSKAVQAYRSLSG